MSNIVNRQIINIALNVATNNNNNQNIALNLRFSPDEVIVRQITYLTAGDTTTNLCQIYSNLVDDLVLATFPVFSNVTYPGVANVFTNNLESHFKIYRKFQNGSFNFQVQFAPLNPVIAGVPGNLVSDDVKGTVNVALEFVQYEE